jgi:hypothetical protein
MSAVERTVDLEISHAVASHSTLARRPVYGNQLWLLPLCPLFLPLQWGARPMALMLWLDVT